MDWNGDGLNDILVGEYAGRIKYYQAVTPDSLTEMDDLQAAGEYIVGGLVGSPMVVDWNNDGLMDLLVGFASPGAGSSIQLYINSGSPGAPMLDAAESVLFGGAGLVAYSCTPWAGDIDQDGLIDIVFGDSQGDFYIALNQGTQGAPVFPVPDQLNAGSHPMNLQLNGAPCIIDWNEDGYADIVSGCGEDGLIWAFLSPYTSGTGSASSFEQFTVSPGSNPSGSNLVLEVQTGLPGIVELWVYDVNGRLVTASEVEPCNGTGTVSMDLGHVAEGIYLYRGISGGETASGMVTIMGTGR